MAAAVFATETGRRFAEQWTDRGGDAQSDIHGALAKLFRQSPGKWFPGLTSKGVPIHKQLAHHIQLVESDRLGAAAIQGGGKINEPGITAKFILEATAGV
jgi:hypothetical protein